MLGWIGFDYLIYKKISTINCRWQLSVDTTYMVSICHCTALYIDTFNVSLCNSNIIWNIFLISTIDKTCNIDFQWYFCQNARVFNQYFFVSSLLSNVCKYSRISSSNSYLVFPIFIRFPIFVCPGISASL